MNETEVTVTQKTAFITFWVIAVSLNAISSALLSVAVHRRKSCANILLLSMALTDIIVILLGLTPTVVTLFLNDLTHDGDILCYFQVIVLNWYILMSFFVVVTISIDQFLAVLCPFFYNSKILRVPRRSMKISLGLLFAFGVGILSYSIMGSLLCVLFPLPPTNVCYYNFQSTNLANRIFFFANTIAMGILIIVVVVCTVFLAGKLYQMYLQVDDEEDFFQQQKSSIAKISVIVAIVFMSSASLFMVSKISDYWLYKCFSEFEVLVLYTYIYSFSVSAWFGFVSSFSFSLKLGS